MKKSKDNLVQQFLDELKDFDSEKCNILQIMREIVFTRYPKVSERIMYSGIMFSLGKDFGGLFVSKNHVSFEFSNGYKFADPKKLLEGTGKFRRHLKIKSLIDIEEKEIDFFVKQAA